MPLPLAVTMGDAAGIGPEIIARAFAQAPQLMQDCFVAGDVDTLRRAAAIVQRHDNALSLPVTVIEQISDAGAVPPRCMPVLQVIAPLPPLAPGQISAVAGQAAGDCVFWAARAALRGEIAALVTAPLHKEALAAAGTPYNRYPGHTELLQAVAAEHLGLTPQELPVRMMLASDELRTVLVSVHMSLREAIARVTADNVYDTLCITHQALSSMLGHAPRIAVAGLNPHAGEGGLFGREEIEVIAPAIAQARTAGMDVRGPFAPDTVFMRARGLGEFDVVVAMYHDQGLIPIKYPGVEHGVNVTLGLPLVRTSPDHGTAFDISGTGRANSASLLAAVRTAKQLIGRAAAVANA